MHFRKTMSEGENHESIKQFHDQLLGTARVQQLGPGGVPIGDGGLQKWAYKYLQLGGVTIANLDKTAPAPDNSAVMAITSSQERDKFLALGDRDDLVWPADERIQGFVVVLDPMVKWQLAWNKTPLCISNNPKM